MYKRDLLDSTSSDEDGKHEEEVIREIITRDLIEQHLNDYFKNVTLEKGEYQWHHPEAYEKYGGCYDYNVECTLRLAHPITKEKVEIPHGLDSRNWRRIKGGPKEFSEGGYLSVKKVLELMQSQFREAIDMCEERDDYYQIQRFAFEKQSAVQAICVKNPDRERIHVELIFSLPYRSYKQGYLDKEESFDLLAVPYDPKNRSSNADLWLISKCRLDHEEVLQREREINNTSEDVDRELIMCLEQIERKYLSAKHLQSSQRHEKELVQKLVVDELIKSQLGNVFDDVIFAGGSYEMTGIPGIADYDLECCLRMTKEITEENVERCGHEGWRKIKGGPAKYLERGYLSVRKVREHVYSELKRVIQSSPKNKPHAMELKEFDKGSAAIKMIIIDSSKNHIDVDLVLGVKIKSKTRNNAGHSYSLIAKAFSRAKPDDYPEFWRISASKDEVLMFECDRFNADPSLVDVQAKKWYVFQIMKLIRKTKRSKVLDILPSYFYKQAYILLMEDYIDRPLHERFKEYIYYIVKVLEEHNLIEMMIPDRPNLLARWTPAEVKPVKDFLKYVMEKGAYHKLLEPILMDNFRL